MHLSNELLQSQRVAEANSTPPKALRLQEPEDLPQPHKSELVKLTKRPEQFYASVSFSGEIPASFGCRAMLARCASSESKVYPGIV